MSNLSIANKLMKNGDYEAAASIYKKLIAQSGPVAPIAKFNLSLIEKKWGNFVGKVDVDTPPKIKSELVNAGDQSNKIFIADLYEEVEKNIENSDAKIKLEKQPLVSIIVTAHNTAEYIEACLESLINQTYPFKEIFVVDDVSTDNTSKIIKRIAKSNKNIHYRRLNANLGTYYAKNLGIKESKGEIIFFQDSDDISHPSRIETLTKQILLTQKLVIRGSYSRVDPLTDEILCVNDLYKKLGLITLGIKREVFEKIGFFNCTTKASDDEFFNRVIKFIGKSSVVNNEIPLYYNTYRENSLFADMVTRKLDGSIEQKPSESRAGYVKNFKEIHENSDIESIRKKFAFPRIHDAVTVLPDMTKLSNPKDPVVVNVCSIPQREHAFQKTIESIIDQCDVINIYLDGYKKTPSFLDKHKNKCKVIHSVDLPGLRDNGKFIELEKFISKNISAYYFTIDDDIIYPVDYINTLIKQIDLLDQKCAIGVHGVILKDNPHGYFSDRRIVYNFTKPLEEKRTVNLLGTGTLAFHTSIFSYFSLSSFKTPGMADIYFSIECKKHNIPLLAIARHESWLIDMNPSPDNTLYHEFRSDDSKQAKLIKNNLPWGLSSIYSVINQYKNNNIWHELNKSTIQLRSLTR